MSYLYLLPAVFWLTSALSKFDHCTDLVVAESEGTSRGNNRGCLLHGNISTKDLQWSEKVSKQSNTSVPDEHIDSFAVVCAKHNVGRTQERLQDVHQSRRHLLHLIKNEDGVSTFCKVPLYPALQLPLKTKETPLGPAEVSCLNPLTNIALCCSHLDTQQEYSVWLQRLQESTSDLKWADLTLYCWTWWGTGKWSVATNWCTYGLLIAEPKRWVPSMLLTNVFPVPEEPWKERTRGLSGFLFWRNFTTSSDTMSWTRCWPKTFL